MLTIGQLAAHAGVTTKAVRVYHAKGLLPEPARDEAGYRRYDAQAIIDLTRIVTLAQAGVPLARIPEVLAAEPDAAALLVDRIDVELRDRIRVLQDRRRRLRHLDQPDRLCLPPEAVAYMDRLRALCLSARHERAIRDGWILGHALAPQLVSAILPARTAQLEDPGYVAVLRGYDEAIDWSPDDPRLGPLADAAAAVARRMTMVSDLPSFAEVAPETVRLLTAHRGLDSPAWERLDRLVDERLRRDGPSARAESDTPPTSPSPGRGA